MPRARLDQVLLKKLSAKTGTKVKSLREYISKQAARQGIAAEAVQVLLAMDKRIAATRFLRSLDPHIQAQVRERTGLHAIAPPRPSVADRPSKSRGKQGGTPSRSTVVRTVLVDPELRARCGDLLKAGRKYDRVFREATTVLEDRLKRLGNIKVKMNPQALVGKVVAPNPERAIRVYSKDPDGQEGIHAVCKGLFLAFRNPAHHVLSDEVTFEEALRFSGFVDLLLAILDQTQLNTAAVQE